MTDSFRTYDGMGQSASDYARFLQENPRYAEMLAAQDLDSQLAALGASGYATDPNYARSVGSIARSINIPNAGGQPAARMPGNDQVAQASTGTRTDAGPSSQQIMSVISSPDYAFMSSQQRSALEILLRQALTREQQANDPMRALELERAQLELEQMRNPQPDMTDDMREYEYAVSQGFQGSFQDFMVQMRQAGATQNNVSVSTGAGEQDRYIYGSDAGLPSGWRLDRQTGQASRTPGGPADVEANQAEEDRERSLESQVTNETTRRDVVLDTVGAIREAISDQGVIPDVGVFGSKTTAFNQQAADVAGMLDTLKGMVVFDRLEKLKQASATGASGLGQVTEHEIALLGAQLGALENNLSTPLILNTLDTVESVFGNLSPAAKAYLMGEGADEMPANGFEAPQGQGAGAATSAISSANSIQDLQNMDRSSMTDAQLKAWIDRWDELEARQ